MPGIAFLHGSRTWSTSLGSFGLCGLFVGTVFSNIRANGPGHVHKSRESGAGFFWPTPGGRVSQISWWTKSRNPSPIGWQLFDRWLVDKGKKCYDSFEKKITQKRPNPPKIYARGVHLLAPIFESSQGCTYLGPLSNFPLFSNLLEPPFQRLGVRHLFGHCAPKGPMLFFFKTKCSL